MIIVGLQAYIYKKQWDAMDKGLKQSQDALEIQQRAWLLTRDVKINFVAKDENEQITVNVINDGNSPAFKSIVGVRGDFLKSPPPEVGSGDSIMSQGGEYTIGPKRDIPVPLKRTADSLDHLTPEYVGTAESHGYRLYVWGRIEYEDVFKKSHVTHFCHTLMPDALVFFACKEGNDAN